MPLYAAKFGIMTGPLRLPATGEGGAAIPPEPRLCRSLLQKAESLAVDAYVFTPKDYNPQSGELLGWRLHLGHWHRQAVPLPDVVYNRCFFHTISDRREAAATLSSIYARKAHQFLNSTLPSKIAVYEHLLEDHALSPFLPPTSRYTFETLKKKLRESSAKWILKPASGMQGRGIVQIERSPWDRSVSVKGRTRQNRCFARNLESESELQAWLSAFINGSPFLLQPYLDLGTADHRPYDIRVLLQKDDSGKWQRTGSAARIGPSGSLTSNLHGGGSALRANELLANHFGKTEAGRLLEHIYAVSERAAVRLEQGFGRFGELAFDFGVEPDGRFWLLEANAKPGREVFRLTCDHHAQLLSIERPLRYSVYLTNRILPTFIARDSATGPKGPKRETIPNRPRSLNVQEVHR
ncbi:YheC/YheD family protein [Paenibacillus sp. GCM10027627]|uniref:YheC/YheD family endospore coat-associated protein n=1 Tax=unclassified Paenibacillus TaxID=185978 RepID=UPI0036417A40